MEEAAQSGGVTALAMKILGSDDAKYVLVLVGSIPLAMVVRMVSNQQIRKYLFLVLGLMLAFGLCGGKALLSLFEVTVVYLLLHLRPLSSIPANHMLAITFIWTFLLYVRVNHASSGATNALQLIITLRLTALCWDHDGRREEEKQLKKDTSEGSADRKIVVPLDFIDFYSYAYSFVGLYTGPFYTYDEFMGAVDESYSCAPHWIDEQRHEAKPAGSWFSRVRNALFVVVMWGVLETFFPISFIKTDSFLELPLVQRFGFFVISTYVARMRFYFAWSFAEASCLVSGVGKPFDVQTIDIFKLETALSPAIFTRMWNTRVVRFLDVYVRKKIPKFVPRSLHASAIWHGVEPIYYVAFSIGALWVLASGSTVALYNRFCAPFQKQSQIVQTVLLILAFIVTHVELNFGGGIFCLLNWEKSVKVMGSLYYYGIIGPIIVMLLDFFTKHGGLSARA